MEWVYGIVAVALGTSIGLTGICYSLSNGDRYVDRAGRWCNWGKVISMILLVVFIVLRLIKL